MDWFERLTGFAEQGYRPTQERLAIRNGRLCSAASAQSYAVGQLELVSLNDLRARSRDIALPERLRLGVVEGNVRHLHQAPDYAGALFQVASQFNLLEMVSPGITPEHGVTGYEDDHTQGPACAIAAGAATIYRNYFAPVGDQIGQTADRQLDGLGDLGRALATRLGVAPETLWQMQNGYAFPDRESLRRIDAYLRQAPESDRDSLRGCLRVGLHRDVEVTDVQTFPGPLVSQIYCSALPVGYAQHAPDQWRAFASLVLEAAYEATLRAALLNAARGGSRHLLLTRIGGGVFGNDDAWINAAILRALRMVADQGLVVHMVSYGPPIAAMTDLMRDFEAGAAAQ